MTDIVLTPITSGYNIQKVNDNFDKIEAAINDDVVHNKGGNNVMQQDLDMNSKKLLNVPKPILQTDVARLQDITDSGGQINTNSNAGTGAELVKAKVDLDTPIRTVLGGDNVTVVQGVDTITISSANVPDGAAAVKTFSTLDLAITSIKLFEGDAFNIAERTTGNGGSAMWDVVLASGVSISAGAPDVGSVIASVGNPLLAFVLREQSGTRIVEALGLNTTKAGETINEALTELDTAATQFEVVATGGVVELPEGVLPLEEKILLHNPDQFFNIQSYSLEGKGRHTTLLDAAGVAGNAIDITQGVYNHMSDFTLSNAQGEGIFIDDGALSDMPNFNSSYERLVIRDSVGNGFYAGRGFIQSYSNMEYISNGEAGHYTDFRIHTSQHHKTSYSRNNIGAGFSSEYLIYSSYSGCASDENLYGYQAYGNRAVHYDSCGAESNRRAGYYFLSDATHEINWVSGTSCLGVNNDLDSIGYANHTELLAADGVTNFVALKQPVSLAAAGQTASTPDFKATGKGAMLTLEDPLMGLGGTKAIVGGYIQVNYTAPQLVHALTFTGPQDSRTLPIGIKNQNGLTGDWSGKLLITASNGDFGDPSNVGTATYELNVSQSNIGPEQQLISEMGLVTGSSPSHPSFTFITTGSGLIAMAKSATAGTFWFSIEKVAGNLMWT